MRMSRESLTVASFSVVTIVEQVYLCHVLLAIVNDLFSIWSNLQLLNEPSVDRHDFMESPAVVNAWYVDRLDWIKLLLRNTGITFRLSYTTKLTIRLQRCTDVHTHGVHELIQQSLH